MEGREMPRLLTPWIHHLIGLEEKFTGGTKYSIRRAIRTPLKPDLGNVRRLTGCMYEPIMGALEETNSYLEANGGRLTRRVYLLTRASWSETKLPNAGKLFPDAVDMVVQTQYLFALI